MRNISGIALPAIALNIILFESNFTSVQNDDIEAKVDIIVFSLSSIVSWLNNLLTLSSVMHVQSGARETGTNGRMWRTSTFPGTNGERTGTFMICTPITGHICMLCMIFLL